jgi:LysM repeat protein
METTMVTLAGALADARGLFISMLLIALLALKEFAQSTAGPRAKVWTRALQVAIVPLLLLFGLAITLRLTQEPHGQPAQTNAPTVRVLATAIQATTLPAAVPAPTAPAAATETLAYSVRQGDLLFDLALRFNTSVAAIVALNPQINPDSLVIGDVLRIPAVAATPDAPKAAARPGEIVYIIRSGDTLYDLAPRFKTSVAAIAALNPQIAPERLMVGQELRIPIAQLQPTQERKP